MEEVTAQVIEETKKEPILVQYIKNRVLNENKNFVMVFLGATGSGKSYSALRLAQLLEPDFSIERVSFKALDFMRLIDKLVNQPEHNKGIVLMWDEFGVAHNAREFMTQINRVINFFFQTSRHYNFVILMTVPFLSYIDSATRKLIHATAEMQGINKQKKYATIKVKMLQANVITGKEYPKYLRYKKNHKRLVSKKLRVSLPTPELIEAYENKRKPYTQSQYKETLAILERNEEKKRVSLQKFTDKQIEIAKLIRNNTPESIAKLLNVSKETVYQQRRRMERKGVEFKPKKDENGVLMGYHVVGMEDFLEKDL